MGGRQSAIRDEIAGFITNPNNAFEANFVPVHTTGAFLSNPIMTRTRPPRPPAWPGANASASPYSATGETLKPEEIALLIDLLYQPFRAGPQSTAIVGTRVSF